MTLQKILITLLLSVCIFQFNYAQDIIIPQNVKLKSEADYKNFETDVLNCLNWLEKTPINQHTAMRARANTFLVQWATGTPFVTIDMQSFQVDVTKKNASLLMTFIGGWVKLALENPTKNISKLEGNIAGFQSLIKVYSNNKTSGIKKDKRLEKLLKMDVSELTNWISEKLK